MNMIERVARSIGIKRQEQAYGKTVIRWEEYEKYYQEALKDQAKAVIEAMREPSEWMKECCINTPHYLSINNFRAIWNTGIDAALKEDDNKPSAADDALYDQQVTYEK